MTYTEEAFTADDKNDAQAAFMIALHDPSSEQAREYLTYLREIRPTIPEDTTFRKKLLRTESYVTIERLQLRWLSENREPNSAA